MGTAKRQLHNLRSDLGHIRKITLQTIQAGPADADADAEADADADADADAEAMCAGIKEVSADTCVSK